MNIFEYLNNLLFGPTLEFVASSKYSLDDAVLRLRAAVIPRFSLAGIFQTGLKGTVRSDHVCVRWKRPFRDQSVRPAFSGSFVSSVAGVQLVGRIGVPLIQKVVLLALSILPPILLFSFVNSGILPRFIWFAFPVELAIILVGLVVARAFHQRDFQLIADALDNALS